MKLKPTLHKEHAVESARAREFRGRLKDDLGQMLSVALDLALRAYEIVNDVDDVEPMLREQINGSLKLIKAQKAQWDALGASGS